MSAVTAPPQSPAPRRVALPRWVDARLIAGILLVVIAVGTGARVVAHAESRRQVVAYTRDLAAGATVQPDDLAYVRAGLPREQSSVYVALLAQAVGSRLGRAVTRGELVTRDSLAPPVQTTTVVVPLAPAAAPEVHRGQRITVWSSAPGCDTIILIPEATVEAVTRGDGSSFESAGSQQVVLALSDADAARVVSALAAKDVLLRAGLLSGGPRSAPSMAAGQCKGSSG